MFKNKSSNSFFTIYDGKFVQKVQPGTPGAKERVNKIGNTVFELFHDSFDGKLIDIRTQESADYGKSWYFDFEGPDGKVYSLQLPYSNSFATAILKILPNVNVDESMTLTPSVKMVEGKNRSTMFINQGGVGLKHAYTMTTPNGMPDMVQIVVKGQKVWDDTDRIEFLHSMVQKDILPKLSGKTESVVVASSNDFSDLTPEDLDINVPKDERSELEKEFDAMPAGGDTKSVDEVDY